MYSVKELFYTLQGEGHHAGCPAVFVRFTGCNLWNGGADRVGRGACARWCDTDFVGTDGINGGKYGADDLARTIFEQWPKNQHAQQRVRDRLVPLVVFTGGEPLLQLDGNLIRALRAKFKCCIAVETNGSVKPKWTIGDAPDWICLSPKPGGELVLKKTDELKLIFPQDEWEPGAWEDFSATHLYIQPKDAPDAVDAIQNRQRAVDYVLEHPRWNLSLQTHKIVGLP